MLALRCEGDLSSSKHVDMYKLQHVNIPAINVCCVVKIRMYIFFLSLSLPPSVPSMYGLFKRVQLWYILVSLAIKYGKCKSHTGMTAKSPLVCYICSSSLFEKLCDSV